MLSRVFSFLIFCAWDYGCAEFFDLRHLGNVSVSELGRTVGSIKHDDLSRRLSVLPVFKRGNPLYLVLPLVFRSADLTRLLPASVDSSSRINT